MFIPNLSGFIKPLNYKNHNHNIYQNNCIKNNNLIIQDEISFGSMKKNQFSSFDYAVIEKYKAPIEKFNSKLDFDLWLKNNIQDIKKQEFKARRIEPSIARQFILDDWYNFLENNNLSKSEQLIILNSIVKDLKINNDTLPPILDEIALDKALNELEEKLKINPKSNFDFKKIYEKKLKEIYQNKIENIIDNKKNGWLVIPSLAHDKNNFKENVEKLKLYSLKTWCTKGIKAKEYLENGDFHIYLENNIPKVALRVSNMNEVTEIQGEENNSLVPIKYLDEIINHIEKNNYKISFRPKIALERAKSVSSEVNKAKEELDEAIKNKDYIKILKYFDIEARYDENNMLILSDYHAPELFKYKDIDIDEKEMFQNIIEIENDANFERSSLIDLGALKKIGGKLFLFNSNIINLKNLVSIGDDVSFSFSKVQDLGALKKINGDAIFSYSKIQDLGSLEEISGHANFNNSEVSSLGNLKEIKDGAEILNSKLDIKDFKNIKVDIIDI